MPNLLKARADSDPHKMIEKLISLNRDELWHMESANIAVVWVYPDMKKDGKLRIGSAQKCNPLLALFTDLDFVIKLSAEYWESEMTDEEKEAVILHELRHCGVKKDKKTGQPLGS